MYRKLLAILFVSFLCALSAAAQENSDRIEAKYLFSYGPPGSPIELSQPQQIRYDRSSGEIYICDTGHNRIVILDSLGLYLFEFGNSDVMRSPTDVAVDSDGRIYVLGSAHPESPVNIFDYNGEFLRPMRFQGGPDVSSIAITSMVMDGANRLHLLDENGARILSYNGLGEFVGEISLMPKATDAERGKQVWGDLSLFDDRFYAPNANVGMIFIYDMSESLLSYMGESGGGYGKLSIPVAVSVDTNGNILVLDKNRCRVLCYNRNGVFGGELGGIGDGPGRFYMPRAVLIDNRQRLWVVQEYKGLVQALQLQTANGPATVTVQEPVVIDN